MSLDAPMDDQKTWLISFVVLETHVLEVEYD
jgi:hypothetical protein